MTKKLAGEGDSTTTHHKQSSTVTEDTIIITIPSFYTEYGITI